MVTMRKAPGAFVLAAVVHHALTVAVVGYGSTHSIHSFFSGNCNRTLFSCIRTFFFTFINWLFDVH